LSGFKVQGLRASRARDYFSVQPAQEMAPARLNAALTAFLAQTGVVRMESKEAFYARHPDLHPNAVGFSVNA
jgi:hypothetical protein